MHQEVFFASWCISHIMNNKKIETSQNYNSIKFNDEQLNLLGQIQLLENATLDIITKLNILQLSTNTRFMTFIAVLGDRYNEKLDIEIADKSKIIEIENFIEKLNLYCVKREKLINNKMTNKMQEKIWIYICSNEFVKNYIDENLEKLTDSDIGCLLGYTQTMILAFQNILEVYNYADLVNDKRTSIAIKTIGRAAHSKLFYDDEVDYYNKIWEQMKKLYPEYIDKLSKNIDL